MKETNISIIMKFTIIRPGIVTLGVFTQIVTLSFKQEIRCFRRVIMRYKVLISISLVSFITITCEGVGISSKLDFGDSHSSPKLVSSATHYRSVSTPHKQVIKNEETKVKKDFEDIGVVCTNGGCNTTNKKENESKDSIETDVVVHVKTSVDLNKKNKTNFIDDIPDIPVIVGTAGTGGSQSRTFNQRPRLPDFNTFSSPDSAFLPSAVPTISSSFTPSFVPYYSTYSSPSSQSGSVYVHSPSLSPEPQVDINIKTLPSVSLTMTNDGRSIKDVRYKANGIEMRYPYFEPSFHNHYFGESPPPQLVWYPKRSGLPNTVDYKPKASWKPSVWSGGTPVGTPHRHTGSGNTCTCKNQPATDLQWYPARKSYQDPGRQIDDKLSELS